MRWFVHAVLLLAPGVRLQSKRFGQSCLDAPHKGRSQRVRTALTAAGRGWRWSAESPPVRVEFTYGDSPDVELAFGREVCECGFGRGADRGGGPPACAGTP